MMQGVIVTRMYWGRLLAALILTVIICVICIAEPNTLSPVGCKFHQLTGYSCPTCGMTRSLHAASHLNIVQSFRFHIMGPIIFAGILFLIWMWGAEYILKRKIRIQLASGVKRCVVLSVCLIWAVYWVMRLANEMGV